MLKMRGINEDSSSWEYDKFSWQTTLLLCSLESITFKESKNFIHK